MATSAIAAVGALIISLQPPGAKDLMVSLFGTNDKLALEVMVFIGGVLIGALIGLAGRRDARLAYAAFVVLAVVGLVLILQDPLAGPVHGRGHRGRCRGGRHRHVHVAVFHARAGASPRSRQFHVFRRARRRDHAAPRRSSSSAATLVAVGAVLAVIGRVLGSQAPAPSTAPVAVPPPRQTVPPRAAGSDLRYRRANARSLLRTTTST